MIGPGRFLCGCEVESKRDYRVEFDQAGRRIERHDWRGPLCPEHGEPLYGWRSKVEGARA